ncbi:hypothetical protein HNR26_003807 [Rhizobium rosettiformans]|uniref:Tape measure protein N-terminal domain-containing protein n=2 Tax=Rhizobium rosettiformans TaxID=1368430 RepID=A0A4V4HQA3_9HYPH|nr:tape measure protein [Rhizobium rosettiformans]MBB5277726.1 hypothetical protein [Rhizobium rosettiformans]THV33066.1 hypothetical protein FAA86_17895 [Rhizobium rosettiformans W3]
MIIEKLVAELGWDLTGEADLKRFQKGMSEAEKGITAFAARAATVMAAAAAAVAAGMGALGKSVISTSAEFEGYQATLETIEGSADKARASLDWVAEFAKTTPYEIGDVTQAFVRLKAYGIDPLDGTLKAAGDAGSAMGVGLMSGVEAIADAITGENERLKAFGITASVAGDQVTYSWQENGKQMSKTLKKSSVEIQKFLVDNFGRRFNDAMDKQSRTWDGMTSNLGDSWTDFQRRIGDAGFFDVAKGQLQRLMDFIGRLDANGSLDRWAKAISDSLSTAVTFVGDFAARIGRHIETISSYIDANSEAWNVLKAVMLGIALGISPIVTGFIVAGLVLDDFLTFLRGGKSVIGDAIIWLGELKDAILEWLNALPDRISDGIRDAFQAAFDGARAVVLDFVAWATEKLAALNPLNWISTAPAPAGRTGTEGSVSLRPEQRVPELDNILAKIQNAQANVSKMSADQAATSLNNTINDSRNQSVTVDVGGVTVTQATDAPAAVGQAVGNAAAGAATRSLPPPRFVPGGI